MNSTKSAGFSLVFSAVLSVALSACNTFRATEPLKSQADASTKSEVKMDYRLAPNIREHLCSIMTQRFENTPAGTSVSPRVSAAGDSLSDHDLFLRQLIYDQSREATVELFEYSFNRAPNSKSTCWGKNLRQLANNSSNLKCTSTYKPYSIWNEIEAHDPHIMVILIGTNDAPDRRRMETTYQTEYKDLLDKLEGRGIIPVITTLPPSGYATLPNETVVYANTFLRDLAKNENLPLIDLYEAIAVDLAKYQASDKLHLSREGKNLHNQLVLEILDQIRTDVLESGCVANVEFAKGEASSSFDSVAGVEDSDYCPAELTKTIDCPGCDCRYTLYQGQSIPSCNPSTFPAGHVYWCKGGEVKQCDCQSRGCTVGALGTWDTCN